ncbi:hypothetical protein GCM10020218_099440 [Dactylosporangium vinaceum]
MVTSHLRSLLQTLWYLRTDKWSVWDQTALAHEMYVTDYVRVRDVRIMKA